MSNSIGSSTRASAFLDTATSITSPGQDVQPVTRRADTPMSDSVHIDKQRANRATYPRPGRHRPSRVQGEPFDLEASLRGLSLDRTDAAPLEAHEIAPSILGNHLAFPTRSESPEASPEPLPPIKRIVQRPNFSALASRTSRKRKRETEPESPSPSSVDNRKRPYSALQPPGDADVHASDSPVIPLFRRRRYNA